MSLSHQTISETPFCFADISTPLNCTEMVLYSKFAYGSQFLEEEKTIYKF